LIKEKINPFIIYYFVSSQVERAADTGDKHTHVLCSQHHARFISPPPPRLQKCSPHARRLSPRTGYIECVGCAGLRGPRGVLSVNTRMLKAVQKSQWLAPVQSQPPLTSHTHGPAPCSMDKHCACETWLAARRKAGVKQWLPLILDSLVYLLICKQRTDKIQCCVSATLATRTAFIATPAPTPHGWVEVYSSPQCSWAFLNARRVNTLTKREVSTFLLNMGCLKAQVLRVNIDLGNVFFFTSRTRSCL